MTRGECTNLQNVTMGPERRKTPTLILSEEGAASGHVSFRNLSERQHPPEEPRAAPSGKRRDASRQYRPLPLSAVEFPRAGDGDNQENIGISGGGVIDGQGKILAEAVIGPIKPGQFPDAGEAKRPVLINIRNCRDVSVRDVTLRESACWVQLYRDCDRILIENITVRNLEIYDTYFSGIALKIVDGGVMENVNISQVRMTTTNNPIFIRLGHRNAKGPVGSIKGVTISDVTTGIPNRARSEMNKFPRYWRHLCTTLITGSITGLPGHPVRDVTLKNIAITYGGIGDAPKPGHLLLKNLESVPECAENYPESKMFGVLPAWGLYCRHAERLVFENVTLRVTGRDYRAAAVFDDVSKLMLDRFNVLSAGNEPVIVLNNVERASCNTRFTPCIRKLLVPMPSASEEVILRMPALTVMLPVKEVLEDKVVVPVPEWMMEPVPEISLASVQALVRLMVRGPLRVTSPGPKLPVVPAFPSCRPPELMVVGPV